MVYPAEAEPVANGMRGYYRGHWRCQSVFYEIQCVAWLLGKRPTDGHQWGLSHGHGQEVSFNAELPDGVTYIAATQQGLSSERSIAAAPAG
jgi:hypothetical protein